MRIATSVRNAMADAAVDLVDVGAGTAVVEIYTGDAPAAIGDAPAGDLLVSFDLDDPAFGAAAAGVATLLGVPIVGTGVAAGTAAYARVVNQNGDALMDTESVGTADATVIMSTLTVSVDLTVNLNAMTMTQPAGSV